MQSDNTIQSSDTMQSSDTIQSGDVTLSLERLYEAWARHLEASAAEAAAAQAPTVARLVYANIEERGSSEFAQKVGCVLADHLENRPDYASANLLEATLGSLFSRPEGIRRLASALLSIKGDLFSGEAIEYLSKNNDFRQAIVSSLILDESLRGWLCAGIVSRLLSDTDSSEFKQLIEVLSQSIISAAHLRGNETISSTVATAQRRLTSILDSAQRRLDQLEERISAVNGRYRLMSEGYESFLARSGHLVATLEAASSTFETVLRESLRENNPDSLPSVDDAVKSYFTLAAFLRNPPGAEGDADIADASRLRGNEGVAVVSSTQDSL